MPTDAAGSACSVESRIKEKARRLGFSACCITSAHPPLHHNDYRDWLDEGMAGEMGYLHRQEAKRASLENVLHGAKSLIVVALNYYTKQEVDGGAFGVVARYARFDDYHHTMWTRLDLLGNFVRSECPEATIKSYCDTGPITERDYAMRAGLGWIGKHTNLISRKLGNWFFIGELIVDRELAPDAPESNHCGTCQRCLPACPTGAIVAPFKLDARRCISYLTIELKGSIPVELRPLIGNRVYGCDDCLAVCPWNKFAVKSNDPAVQPRADLQNPDLYGLLRLSDGEFKLRFSNSPIMRTKRRGLLRNVCVALGNAGDRAALPHLAGALRDDEPLVQEHANWAVEQIERRQEMK